MSAGSRCPCSVCWQTGTALGLSGIGRAWAIADTQGPSEDPLMSQSYPERARGLEVYCSPLLVPQGKENSQEGKRSRE